MDPATKTALETSAGCDDEFDNIEHKAVQDSKHICTGRCPGVANGVVGVATQT